MIKTLLVEDHAVVRNGLKMLLEFDENIEIVGEASNGAEALEMLSANGQVNLVLSDINMPGMDGIELTQAIRAENLEVKIVLLSMHDKETFIYEGFKAGCDAYLLKSVSSEELIFALKHVNLGEQYLSSSLSMEQVSRNMKRVFPKTDQNFELTDRELEVLDLLSKGMTNQEISDKLFLSKRTVEGHRQNLIDKFAVRNTAELICISMRAGLIS